MVLFWRGDYQTFLYDLVEVGEESLELGLFGDLTGLEGVRVSRLEVDIVHASQSSAFGLCYH